MKKTILSVVVMALMAVSAIAQNNNNDHQLIALAKAALKQQCDNTQGTLLASVSVVSTCFDEGYITNVTFYKKPNCPPNQACIQVIYHIGTVQLGCDNSVISVDCGTRMIQ